MASTINAEKNRKKSISKEQNRKYITRHELEGDFKDKQNLNMGRSTGKTLRKT